MIGRPRFCLSSFKDSKVTKFSLSSLVYASHSSISCIRGYTIESARFDEGECVVGSVCTHDIVHVLIEWSKRARERERWWLMAKVKRQDEIARTRSEAMASKADENDRHRRENKGSSLNQCLSQQRQAEPCTHDVGRCIVNLFQVKSETTQVDQPPSPNLVDPTESRPRPDRDSQYRTGSP